MKILLTTVLLLVGGIGFSQLSNSTLTANADAHTSLGAPTTNYGSADSIPIWVQNTSNYKRGYVKFDMSGIPAGAIIVSAKLSLSIVTEASGIDSTSFVVSASNTAWVEGTINANGNVAANPVLAGVNKSTYIAGTTAKRQFELKEHVQAMVDGRVPNYGWFIRRSTETATTPRARYYSREHSVTTRRPQLIIQYYIPASVSAATITHATSLTSTNGGVTPTVIDGSSTGRTYRWYNSSGTQISTTQNLTGVGYGWYGMKSYGTTEGDTLYYGFIVGAQCEEVTVNIPQNPNYFSDAMVYDLVAGSTDYGQGNYGGYTTLLASSWTNGPWYDARSFMKFQLWVDPGLTINQADLLLSGGTHSNQDRNNVSELLRVTQNWREYGVSHSNRPSTTTTGKVDLPVVANGTTNSTIDLRGFFNTWKSSNATNYGFLMQLTDYTNTYTRRQYHSSDATTASLRPALTMKVAIPNCDLSTRGSVSSVFNASSNGFDLTVSIDPPSWSNGPFRYFISDSPIPDIGQWYRYIKDSVYNGSLDSTVFYGGGTSSLSQVFSNQTDGKYYFAVFDSKGRRVFNKEQTVQFPLNFLSVSGVTKVNQTFSTAGSNGYGALDRYVAADQGGELHVTPSGTTNQQVYGITDFTRTVTSSSDIRHGFKIQSGQLSFIRNFSSAGTPTSISASSTVRMVLTNKYIGYYIDDQLFYSDSIYDTLMYKPAMWMAAGSSADVVLKGLNTKPVVVFPVKIVNVYPPTTNRNCNTQGELFSFSLGIIASGTTHISYVIGPHPQIASMNSPVNISSGSIAIGSANGPFTHTLPSGIYQIAVTLLPSNTVVKKTLIVGVEATWIHSSAVVYAPNSYSMKTTSASLGKALTKNLLPSQEATAQWFWFQPQFGVMMASPFMNFFKYPKYSLSAGVSSVYPSQTLGVNDNYYTFLKNGSTVTPAYHPAGQSNISLLNQSLSNRKYYILVQNNEARLYSEAYQQFTLLHTTTRASSHLRLITNASGMIGGGFKNVFSTQCIPVTEAKDMPCYEAQRDLTAGFTFAYQNRLKFTLDEEYDVPSDAKLQYRLYSDGHTELGHYLMSSTTAGAPALNYRFDDNRCEFDLTPFASQLTVDKFYLLEIITSKGDRRFVRFQLK